MNKLLSIVFEYHHHMSNMKYVSSCQKLWLDVDIKQYWPRTEPWGKPVTSLCGFEIELEKNEIEKSGIDIYLYCMSVR